ncbi:alkaline phosphatase [Puteibacter caeruleilacunae]|nr:alkaline phosphatase [Puteibacter caeruleilacunae]
MQRREFIQKIACGSAALVLPITFSACGSVGKRVKFGVCADVHKDIMHDADDRLKEFVRSMKDQEAEFTVQLGDFCRPYEYNTKFLNIWNSFPGPKHHVLGNHDMDGGFSREEVVKFWGSHARYYSFDIKGIHFIVLDGNDLNPSEDRASGYKRYIAEGQLNWLKRDLELTDKHVIVFSHQSLENEEGIENSREVRGVLENAVFDSGEKKVLASLSGHHHTDYAARINDIYYIQINSMSYSWLGGDYKTIRYSAEVDKEYPWIKYTVPYKKPLFASVEVTPNGFIKILGAKTEFVGPTPTDLGVPVPKENSPIVPTITTRTLDL